MRQSNNPPLHLMPLFSDYWPNAQQPKLPASETFYETTFSLPTFTKEPYCLIDSYIAAFKKISDFLAFSNNDLTKLHQAIKSIPN